MKDQKYFNGIIVGLALILSVLSLILVLKTKTDLARQHFMSEEALRTQLSEAVLSVESLQEKQAQLEKKLEDMDNNTCRDVNVKSIAHRGASAEAPENTLPAFWLAKKLGFSCVETDVRFTADGIPVCIHDQSIDRTSNGNGAVSGMTLEELRQYDFGSWKDEQYAGTEIPTFEEFISLCKNIGLHPYIEMKEGTPEQIRQLVETVDRYGMRGKVSWISFELSLLSNVSWYDNEARLGFVVNEPDQWTFNEVRGLRTGKNEVFLSTSKIIDSDIEECRRYNIPLELWTIDDAEQMTELDPYISGVTSNSLRYGQILFEKEMN